MMTGIAMIRPLAVSLTVVLIFLLALASCGGGTTDRDLTIDVAVNSDKMILPVNANGTLPTPGSEFVALISVQVKDRYTGAPVANGLPVSLTLSEGQASAELYQVAGDTPAFSQTAPTSGGIASFWLLSKAEPGLVRLRASANDPGATDKSAAADIMVNVGPGTETGPGNGTGNGDNIGDAGEPIFALAFAGTFASAVQDLENTLVGAVPEGGVYSRTLQVLAIDRNGNPALAGLPVSFSLIDAPLTGYPDSGRGEFTIAGADGIVADSATVNFTTQASSLALARINDRLLLGIGEDFYGSRRISAAADVNNSLTMETPMASLPASLYGTLLDYVIGRPAIGSVDASALTDANGRASVTLRYPDSQLGRSFIVIATAADGAANSRLDGWYLGVNDGSILEVVPTALTLATDGGSATVRAVLRGGLDGPPLAGYTVVAVGFDAQFIEVAPLAAVTDGDGAVEFTVTNQGLTPIGSVQFALMPVQVPADAVLVTVSARDPAEQDDPI